MAHKTLILLLLVLTVLGCASCGAVKESADEGQNAFENGMKTKKTAQDLKAKKEAYDSQADNF